MPAPFQSVVILAYSSSGTSSCSLYIHMAPRDCTLMLSLSLGAYAHARGAVSELRLAIDLPALQGSSRIQTSCNTCSGKTLSYYC